MNAPIRIIEKCPRCNGPVEYGFVYGDRGVFWDTEIRSVGFPEERLTKKRLGLLEPLPGARCRTCRLVVFQTQAPLTRLGSGDGGR